MDYHQLLPIQHIMKKYMNLKNMYRNNGKLVEFNRIIKGT